MFDPNDPRQYVEHLVRVIANFERVRENLTKRRRGASNALLVQLDERLALNARALAALHRSLEAGRRSVPQLEQSGVSLGEVR